MYAIRSYYEARYAAEVEPLVQELSHYSGDDEFVRHVAMSYNFL